MSIPICLSDRHNLISNKPVFLTPVSELMNGLGLWHWPYDLGPACIFLIVAGLGKYRLCGRDAWSLTGATSCKLKVSQLWEPLHCLSQAFPTVPRARDVMLSIFAHTMPILKMG